MKISNSKYGIILSTPGLIIIVGLVIFPIITLFVTSFLRYTSMHPISFIGVKNYQYIFRDRLFWLALRKTVTYTVGVTGVAFVGGMLIALALSNITKYAAMFRSLAMFSWAVPLVISGFIWKWIFNPNVGIFSDILMKLGLISEPILIFSNVNLAMMGCIIADAWVRIPYMTIFFLAGLESVPSELYDAARIDGADCFSAFRQITLPLIKHMVLVGLLITTMFTFRTIDVIFSMTEGGPARGTYVLGFYIVDQLWRRVNYGTASAAGVIMFCIIAVFAGFYLYQIYKNEE
ncbi:ABC transporter permease subunit [candidate division KSB3 bacterium]|uniref:ABC transporter permease subunit n=1 Tax=candidate division KSB3 bacterium TaxID=2044937 RepID=A0A9D5Q4N9_9BACT|nr:ABC transporter permease subunit [candidate division KSB3 bacterium]MBD3323116.1 ABC transporter permease subunit [candidate division KSB3 bacterium]